MKIRVPSIPSQQKVWCGKVLVSFQESLLGQEPAGSGGAGNLRHCRGVAEGVRQPDLLRFDAELGVEELLPGDELAGQRLPAGQVRVRLDPHPAGRDKAAGPDLVRHPREQLRVILFQPGILLRGGGGENELRVRLQQRQDIREGPGNLALGLPDGPEPGAVDVRVADRVDPVRAVGCRCGEYRLQHCPTGRRAAGDVRGIQRVEGAFQRAQDLGAARLARIELEHELLQHREVLQQFPGRDVTQRNVGTAEGVARVPPGGGSVAERCGLEVEILDQIRVGRRLQIKLDGGARLCVQRHVGVTRLDGLDDPALRGVDQPFGLETRDAGSEPRVQQQLGPVAGVHRPFRRDLPAEPKPTGGPSRPPGAAQRELGEAGRDRLPERDRFARNRPGLEPHRNRRRIDRRVQPLQHEPADPRLDLGPVVVHGTVLSARSAGSALDRAGHREGTADPARHQNVEQHHRDRVQH